MGPKGLYLSDIVNCSVVSSNAEEKKELAKKDAAHKMCRKFMEISNCGGISTELGTSKIPQLCTYLLSNGIQSC